MRRFPYHVYLQSLLHIPGIHRAEVERIGHVVNVSSVQFCHDSFLVLRVIQSVISLGSAKRAFILACRLVGTSLFMLVCLCRLVGKGF
ncbi:MAG: hypothetical protein IK144_06615 [Bacteroidaceae bacterium]|nr:hypothetical protein [Bacteroidaceae bacterium]